MSSWWRPFATFFTVLAGLFFGAIGLAADPRAPQILQDAPILLVVIGAAVAAFVCAFVIAPWKRIRVSFGPPIASESMQAQLPAPHNIRDAMLEEIRELFGKSQYHAILRRARWFSRYLWVEGQVGERIEVGDLVRQAALRVGDREAEAAALIDDLGWSHVVKRQYRQAQSEILEGIVAANEAKVPYWVARGHRHLAGLRIEMGLHDEAYQELDRAASAAMQISKNDRDQMLAAIEYGRALCALRAGDYDRCAEYINSAESIMPERVALRGYFLRGMVLLRKGSITQAESEFQRGTAAASNEGEREEELRNREGLIEVHLTRGELDRAEREQIEVQRIQDETPAPYEHSDPVVHRKIRP